MIAIIFEVIPAVGRKQDYLDIAAAMRPMVEEIEGFISVERFQSMSNPDKLLSISFLKIKLPWTDGARLPSIERRKDWGEKGYFQITGLRLRRFCGIMACTSGLKRPRTAVPIMTPKKDLLAFCADLRALRLQKDRGYFVKSSHIFLNTALHAV